VVGDLPTACDSEFMVSVTATNDQDNRTFSAFGATTIDVGAPGASVFTTSMGGGYGSTSGTSFASPLTAGVIGLLYSAPCASLMALVNADPAEGARYVRDKLFEGVEQVGNLGGQTVTGGRISAGNSMTLIMNACGACPGAFNLAANSQAIGTSTLSWNAPTSGTFDVRYRPVGSDTWTTVNGLNNPSLEVTGLSACTAYEYQVRPLCDGEESDFGASFLWTSEGCCTAPLTLGTGLVGDQVVNLTWSSVLAAQQYTIRYRIEGTTAWMTLAPTDAAFGTVEGLESCTTYEFQVSSSCNGVEGTWSAIITAATSGCGACVDNLYCAANAEDSSDEWIVNVTIGDLQNTSANNNGYGDFTGTAVQIELGATVPVSLTPGFAFFQYNEAWAVFLDADQDGGFSAAEELFTAGPSNTTVTGELTIPATALPGVTRLRVMMKYNAAVQDPCESADYGETEDYCVELLTPLAVDALAGPLVVAFPSPADRVLFIDMNNTATGDATVQVLDESGRIVLQRRMNAGRVTVPVSDLANGIYIYRLSTGNEELARGRFVVSHLW
jgi:serine protease